MKTPANPHVTRPLGSLTVMVWPTLILSLPNIVKKEAPPTIRPAARGCCTKNQSPRPDQREVLPYPQSGFCASCWGHHAWPSHSSLQSALPDSYLTAVALQSVAVIGAAAPLTQFADRPPRHFGSGYCYCCSNME